MSDQAVCASKDIPLKVYVGRRRCPTVHRMRGVGSFEELVGIVRLLWGGSGRCPVVQYDDAEGDRITVASEREWEEAVRLHNHLGGGGRPLRLYAVRMRATGRGPAGNGEKSDSEEVCEDGIEARSQPSMEAATVSVSCREPEVPAPSESGDEVQRHFSREMDGRMLMLLSALYDCDMAQELLAAAPGVDFGTLLRRTCDVDTGRVEVEVLLEPLAGAVQVAAARLLDRLEAARASELLRLGCAVLPDDAGMRYTLGCALAMCGRRDAALNELEAAVRLGFRDAERLAHDVELASVRADERFPAVLRAAGGVPEFDESPSGDVQKLLAVFPSLCRASAQELLRRSGGSAQAAVLALLGEM